MLGIKRMRAGLSQTRLHKSTKNTRYTPRDFRPLADEETSWKVERNNTALKPTTGILSKHNSGVGRVARSTGVSVPIDLRFLLHRYRMSIRFRGAFAAGAAVQFLATANLAAFDLTLVSVGRLRGSL